MIRRYWILVSLFLLPAALRAQINDAETEKVEQYFQKIRGTESELIAFCSGMPKGGDLHHHFTGAIYAEDLFETAKKSNFFVSNDSLFIYPQRPPQEHTRDTSIYQFSDARVDPNIRNRLVSFWSCKDFVPGNEAPDYHFFQAFGRFGPAVNGGQVLYYAAMKTRAVIEHLSYIETMLARPYFDRGYKTFVSVAMKYDSLLIPAGQTRDTSVALPLLRQALKTLASDTGFMAFARTHRTSIDAFSRLSVLPPSIDTLVTVRFLNYASRTSPPTDVLGQLLLSFASCDDSVLLGVNIVAPENDTTSMRDYWLHMQMFALLHKMYPKVPYTLHAGELTRGLVKPEDLTWHIRSALGDAGANRIGHGVDMPYETDNKQLLDYMSTRHIPIEINLTSNEFILGVKDDRHPFPLYYEHHVPIVISTDDPGILRTSITEQFVALAKRYNFVTYKDIKEFTYNSIRYSFLLPKVKSNLVAKLDKAFARWEASEVPPAVR